MSEAKIEQITGLMRREKYRFSSARRVYIPKKNGRLRPLGMPTWSDKLVAKLSTCCWKPITTRSSRTARTASGNPGVAIPHCGK